MFRNNVGYCCPQQEVGKLPTQLLLKLDIPRPSPFIQLLTQSYMLNLFMQTKQSRMVETSDSEAHLTLRKITLANCYHSSSSLIMLSSTSQVNHQQVAVCTTCSFREDPWNSKTKDSTQCRAGQYLSSISYYYLTLLMRCRYTRFCWRMFWLQRV